MNLPAFDWQAYQERRDAENAKRAHVVQRKEAIGASFADIAYLVGMTKQGVRKALLDPRSPKTDTLDLMDAAVNLLEEIRDARDDFRARSLEKRKLKLFT